MILQDLYAVELVYFLITKPGIDSRSRFGLDGQKRSEEFVPYYCSEMAEVFCGRNFRYAFGGRYGIESVVSQK